MLTIVQQRLSSISKLQLFLYRPAYTFTFIRQCTNRTTLAYSDWFHLLKSPANIFEVERLHVILLINGFFSTRSSDTVLGSQLVNCYVSLGCFHEAIIVFNHVPKRSNLAWNAILRGYLQMGQFSKSIEFYHLMISQRLNPDNYTYPLVLKACAELNEVEEGRKVKDLIVINGKSNIYVECALIDMFAKCGSLVEAREVFDEMPHRDAASWGAMICGSLKNGHWFGAIRLFRTMRLDGIDPDSVIVAALLPTFGRLEAKLIGMALHGFAIRSSFNDDLFVSNALIDMYSKCNCTNEALVVFRNIVKRDIVSWSSMISGYSQNGMYQESFELYLEMKRSGITANAIITASILPGLAKLKLFKHGKEMHNYILKQCFEGDIVVASALIEMYASFDSIAKAERIFKTMLHKDDIAIWNSMIGSYSLNGSISLAFGIFQSLWEHNVRPNFITIVSMISMCTSLGTTRQGKEIHGYAIRSGLDMAVSVGNSLIDMYYKCGYLELGVKVFTRIVEKNIMTYNTIISAHGAYGLAEQAFSYCDQMLEAQTLPNSVTFTALLSACSHGGLVEKGESVYNSMIKTYNILPRTEHYACMVDLLGKAGQIEKACKFIAQTNLEARASLSGNLLSACRVHNSVEVADFVGKQILENKMSDCGHFVLLSNIYASTKRWADASKVRALIKEKGLVKKPGSSWIELDLRVHVFYARDSLHPEFSKIQETLYSLGLAMKDEEELRVT